jgi:hypothetical protein
MHTWISKSRLASLLAACYVLAVTTAPLFHNHAAEHGEGCCHGDAGKGLPHPETPKAPAQCPSDGSHCAVCNFLGHKPAPIAEAVPVTSGVLVQEVSPPAPSCVVIGAFSAWHSRAPPACA